MDKYNLIKELLIQDRSIRRFEENREIGNGILMDLVNLTRFCASGRNIQPLKYRIVNEFMERDAIYPLLAWAGYLTDWDGPEKGERPAAYLIQCIDKRIASACLCDDGIELQAITLGATAMGIGGCIIKAFNAPRLVETLGLPEWAEPRYVLALGYPLEKVVIEPLDASQDNSFKYYRTPDKIHHVPKRSLDDKLI